MPKCANDLRFISEKSGLLASKLEEGSILLNDYEEMKIVYLFSEYLKNKLLEEEILEEPPQDLEIDLSGITEG